MKLFGIFSFVVSTLVEGGVPLADFDGKNYRRPARKMKFSKVNPVPKKVLLGYYRTAEAVESYRRFSVGSTSNIPEVDGNPKCQESSLGPNVTKLCVGDITVESGLPVYSDTEFQNEIAVYYETCSITDITPPSAISNSSAISIDSCVLKFSSTNDEDEPNEITFGGLVTPKQIKRIVAGGFGKYEGATGYIEFEYVADNKAGPGYAIYHFY